MYVHVCRNVYGTLYCMHVYVCYFPVIILTSSCVFMYVCMYVVVVRTERPSQLVAPLQHSTITDDYMDDAFNDITLGFCQQLSHFPAQVVLRHTSPGPLLMMLITRICEQAYLVSAAAQHCSLEKYVFRPFIDLIPTHAVFSVRCFIHNHTYIHTYIHTEY